MSNSLKLRKVEKPTLARQLSTTSSSAGPETVVAFDRSKLLDRYAEWDSEEIKDVIYWLRQILGLLFGLVYGLVPVTGGPGFILFLTVSTLLTWMYYGLLLKIDDEEFGGHGTLLMEGFPISVGLFLLAWIVVYSLLHF
eukprot:TRINITY_DN17259_c0_g1_i1.p1 TRINITY_DN17259_c0_g1~~TRINITY_DN17259_c0_g1_i1.p1  ORF type:complete len:139 (-),score=22.82 TRINITY_DN17259_c0_g1_i1:364-780(-)